MNHRPDTPNEIRAILALRFPKAIKREGEPKLPLALDVKAALIDACPDLDPKLIQRFLAKYTRKTSYLLAMHAPNAWRVDLQGNPVDPVSDEAKRRTAHRLQRTERKAIYDGAPA